MKPKTRNLFAIVAGIFLSACTNNLTPSDYMHWMNDKGNRLIVEKQAKNFTFSVQYKTPEYVTLVDLGPNADANAFKKAINEYKGLEYYTFRIGSSDKNPDILKSGIGDHDSVGYSRRLSYFSSGIENDLKLAVGNDTFPCSIFLFERTYNMASFDNFILAFDTKGQDNNCDRVFIFNDHTLGVGQLKIAISRDNIRKIPNLRFS